MAVDDQDLSQDSAEDSDLVRRLRAEIKDRNTRLAEAESAKRELAFVKAGIDTSSKLGQLFAKSFEGDVSDVEAIKAEAKELGLLDPPAHAEPSSTPAAEPHVSDPADNSAAERSALASGASSDDGSGVDPRQVAHDRANDAMAKGASFEVAAGGYIADLAKAAIAGDQRVIVQGQHY